MSDSGHRQEGHLGDRLSGLVDGDLDPTEEVQAREHLETCADCRGQVETLTELRQAMQALPSVEPPSGYLDGLLRRGRRNRAALAGVGAATTALALTVWIGTTTGVTSAVVVPPVDDLVARHAEMQGSDVTTDAAIAEVYESADADDMDEPFRAPEELAGAFRRVGIYHHTADGILQVTYVFTGGMSDGETLSLFEQPGDLDRDALSATGDPDSGEWVQANGRRAWVVEGPYRAVVIERGDMVYTVVGDARRDTLMQVAVQLPLPHRMPMTTRARTLADEVLDTFGFG